MAYKNSGSPCTSSNADPKVVGEIARATASETRRNRALFATKVNYSADIFASHSQLIETSGAISAHA